MTTEPLSQLTTESITSGLRWLVGELINLGVTEIDSNRYKFEFWTANPVYTDTHRGLTIRWAQYAPLEIKGKLPTTAQWITDLQDCLRVARVDIEDGIIRRYWAGERYAKIAQDIGWSRDDVKDVLVNVGGDMRPSKISEEQFAELEYLVNQGYSHHSIREITGVSVDTIQKYFGPSEYTQIDSLRLEDINRLVEDGVPHLEIARTLNVDTKTIRRYFGPSPWGAGSAGFVRAGNERMDKL